MDLSATGCKVRLEGDLSRSMTAGELYTPAILTLPGCRSGGSRS
ncbi:hypothetical protein ULG90_00635 [Halopseudomonas pachastrellae]|nr:hypothetical protein ULG90_00635 [Halopseudomonas pachastrellae]